MRLTISTKLIVLAGVCLLSLLVAGGLGLAAVAAIDRGLQDVVARADARRDAALLDMEHDGIRGDLYAALATADPAARGEAADGIAERVVTLRGEVARLQRDLAIESRPAGDPLRRATTEIAPLLDTYLRAAEDQAARIRTDPVAAAAAMPGLDDAFRALEDPLERQSQLILDEAAAVRRTAADRVTLTSRVVLLGTLVAAVVIVVLALRIRRGILASARRLRGTVRALGAGDLRAGIPPDPNRAVAPARGDELERIQHELDGAIGAVRITLTEIDEEVLTLTTAADQFTAISNRLMRNAQGTPAAAQEVPAAAVAAPIRAVPDGAGTVSGSIAGISRSTPEAGAVDETTEAAVAAERGAADVARMASHVKELLDGFRY